MFTLKPLSGEGVPAALKKAERYRLLNEPWEAESICEDILELEPDNQDALILMLLARTDQFASYSGATIATARELLPRLQGDYERAYYTGIILERQATSLLERTGTGHVAHGLLVNAMEHYEAAETLRPAGNDDAILRWNTCARTIMRHPHVRPDDREPVPTMLE
jgi:hypothetical protein